MEFLEQYNIQLKTIGPVFIGSGEVIDKTDYVIQGEKVIIPNINKMYQWIIKNNYVDSYEESKKRGKNLNSWLWDNQLGKIYEEWKQYSISITKEEQKSFRELNLFIRDAFGNPYVPGSSLKGALRTVITAGLLNNEETREKRNIIESLERMTKKGYVKHWELKNILKGIDGKVNKIMRGIRISDSEPLNNEDLFISNKVDAKVDGDENILPLYREYLKPGTQVNFEMTFDSSVKELRESKITVETIKKYIEEFYTIYDEIVIEKFGFPQEITDNILYLGGGAGFFSKTLEYSLMEEAAVSVVAIILHKEIKTKGKIDNKFFHKRDKEEVGISPRVLKMTEYEGKFYEVGKCYIEIKE